MQILDKMGRTDESVDAALKYLETDDDPPIVAIAQYAGKHYTYAVAKIKAEMNKQNAEMRQELKELRVSVNRIASGGLVLLRDRIIQSCRAFIERGKITITARNNIRDMYKCYHDEFNGNGDGEYYYNEMMGLPIDQDVPIVSNFPLGGEVYDRKN